MKKHTIRIAEGNDFSPEVVLKLQQFFLVEMTACSQNQVSSSLQNCDVFWFRLGLRITEKDIPANLRCKVIATPVTGTDHIDKAACDKAGISIISLKGETEFLKNVRATAEHTMLLALLLCRHPHRAMESVRKGVWNRDLFRGNEIFEKTVGIVGLGRLGEIVGSYFLALGARVIGFDKVNRKLPGIIVLDSLEELARQSDIISIHLSLDESTKHIINGAFFSKVKRNCIVINTSRGGIVDEEALLAALNNGIIGAAALDVLQDEKMSMSGNALIEYANHHDNLVITPHIGGNTFESFQKSEHFIAEKVISFFKV
ncbi:MAG: NAD(P)-dependent oxidoreductase [Cytophagales bacterium]|nr:NAD(P)-dependent oxidoreductase [Cytophagales bacterium]